jgi:hypothetical protein
MSSFTTADGKTHQLGDVWFAKDVQPQQPEHAQTTPVSLGDVLAAPTTPVLAAAAPAEPAHTPPPDQPDAHLAALDRKLAEEEEQRRNSGTPWI